MWTLIGAAAVILILIAGYAVGVAPALATASSADEEISAVELQNQIKLNELNDLKKLAENSDKLFADLGALRTSIPSTHESSVFAQQVSALAVANGVTFVDIAYINATAALSPVVAAPAAPAADVEGAPAATTTEPAAPAEESGVTSVPSVAGLVAMDVTISASGTYEALNAFIESVQSNTRSFSVSTASVQIGSEAGTYELSLNGSVYVLQTADSSSLATGGGEVN
tara:strand:- start:45547 stop:46227 length:681 start_codon:yes stop_codon:yes gene_type:complete